MASPLIILADMDSQTAASWFAAWGTIIAAILSTVVAALAIFGEWIRGKVFKPKCNLECGTSDAFLHEMTNNGKMWKQVRLRVWNTGNAPAHEVEVHLLAAFKMNGKNRSAVSGFVPVRLNWTHGGPITKSYIARATFAFVDFGSLSVVQEAQGTPLTWLAKLSLSGEVGETNLWDYRGGSYQFEVGVVTPSGYLQRSVFEVSFENQWGNLTGNKVIEGANFSIKQINEIACGVESCGCGCS
jgi:hypothetical protein